MKTSVWKKPKTYLGIIVLLALIGVIIYTCMHPEQWQDILGFSLMGGIISGLGYSIGKDKQKEKEEEHVSKRREEIRASDPSDSVSKLPVDSQKRIDDKISDSVADSLKRIRERNHKP